MSPKARARREPSGLFSLFQAAQVQQFKEAFQLIDNDKDGIVSIDDLRQTFSSLGQLISPTVSPSHPPPPPGISPSQSTLDALLAARPGTPDKGINFTMFLAMMSERLVQFDPEVELKEAFECFDEADTGTVKADELRKWMSDVGERMDQQEVPSYPRPVAPLTPLQIDKFFNSSFTDRHENFNYREWIKVLRINDDADQPEHPS